MKSPIRRSPGLFALFLALASGIAPAAAAPSKALLQPESFHRYFDTFASQERAFLGSAPPLPWSWFAGNMPLVDLPDKQMEEIYYFRWYAFQKHIKPLPDGTIVIDEFLDRVGWAGKFNAINDSAEHHMREARWLRDPRYANEDARFWVGPNSDRHYSLSTASAVYQLFLATGDRATVIGLLPGLIANNTAWDDHRDASGLYWSIDDRDAMEKSISGNGLRPTLNSYMLADNVAIARIAQLAGDAGTAATYLARAEELRALIEKTLWDPTAQFYEVVPRTLGATWAGVRELIGYIPWIYQVPAHAGLGAAFPDPAHAVAWKQLTDSQGFAATYGPTTAERRSPRFMLPDKHECLWNGPSWPFATSQILVALANLLDDAPAQDDITAKDYFDILNQYVLSQRIKTPSGAMIPWIDEDLDGDTDTWLARTDLESHHRLPANRGRYYNHSTFADLIITGLLGIRPAEGNTLEIKPLLPATAWGYFALQDLPYHGHMLTLVYDKSGAHYHRGAGLRLFADGVQIASAPSLKPLTARLPRS